jgi:acyl-CoA synthetase (AMP-forming)/AMP-acid ligase II
MPNGLVLAYGASELNPGTHFMIRPLDNYDPNRANVVGLAIGQTHARIVDLDGRELPSGERGLIEIKPDSKPFPYVGQGDEWKKHWTEDEHLKTGDVGVISDDGWLDAQGRHSDRFVGSDSREHYMFDIDRVISENPNVDRAISVQLDYPPEIERDPAIVGYIQLEPESAHMAEATLGDLLRHAEENLELGARPLAYRFVDGFPRRSDFKTDLKALARQREWFYVVEDGQLLRVDFNENGGLIKKPAHKVKITKISTKS